MDAPDAALNQAEHHGPRRPAGAKHQRVLGAIPARRGGIQIADETLDVRIGGPQDGAIIIERVGCADGSRALVWLRQLQRPLLVRDRDIGAHEAVPRKMHDEFGESFRRNRLNAVAARYSVQAQPIVMDQRRARMRRGPSDQAGGPACCPGCHHASRRVTRRPSGGTR
jgi:hypothetical protein